MEVHYGNINVSKACIATGVQCATNRLACMSPAASLARLGYFAVPALGTIGIVVAEVITSSSQGGKSRSEKEVRDVHVPARKGLVAEHA